MIGATLAGGSLAGLVLAVDLAGFSAYIIAAQASAFIPLVGGKTAVSLLAVLANPLIALGVLGIGGWFAASSAGSAANRAIAARLAVLLALGMVMPGPGQVFELR